jgi:amylosucrase
MRRRGPSRAVAGRGASDLGWPLFERSFRATAFRPPAATVSQAHFRKSMNVSSDDRHAHHAHRNGHADSATPDALRAQFADAFAPGATRPAQARIEQALTRWDTHAPRLFSLLRALYGHSIGFDAAAAQFARWIGGCADGRPEALRVLDTAREQDPAWFLAQDMIGYTTYVDRFGGTLTGMAARVPYLQRLGVRYLHLLPFLRAREGDNDGGFAVRDYDTIEPALGNNEDLDALTACLRDAGISLCADLVLNHTADDHAWALAARRGDPRYRDYFHIFPDRSVPDAYERTLGQIFPQTAPGNFTHVPDVGWVWTTFYGYQWDLNWSNPDVFVHMALTMLRLANRGIEAFRLDSTAFLWKRPGTDCMNQPEAHTILQALRAVVAIAAPGVLLKAEAIVPARQLPPYFGLRDGGQPAGNTTPECHLAYHSTLMAAAWVALAEQRGDVLADVIDATPSLPRGCGWLTYLRCHDDIGWNVLREEAAGGVGRASFDLLRIERFYAGETADSYARGRRFQSGGEDHVHGSNGMASALAGIADARARGDATALGTAEARLRLLYGIVFASAGLPCLYMGDEIALGNDETYADDPERAAEGRWLHRPAMPWFAAEAAAETAVYEARAVVDNGVDRHAFDEHTLNEHPLDEHDLDEHAIARRIGRALRALIAVRQHTTALRGDAAMRVLPLRDPALLGIVRGEDFVALCNLSDREVAVEAPPTSIWASADTRWRDLLDGRREVDFPACLAPYALRWLLRDTRSAK